MREIPEEVLADLADFLRSLADRKEAGVIDEREFFQKVNGALDACFTSLPSLRDLIALDAADMARVAERSKNRSELN